MSTHDLSDLDPVLRLRLPRPTTSSRTASAGRPGSSVEPLCRGPEPRPDWVVTSQAAIDTELGILKTGKEADAFLVERAVPDSAPLRRVRGDGGQALPQQRAPQLSPGRGLHRGPQRQAVARPACAQAQEHLGPARRRRRVGHLPSGTRSGAAGSSGSPVPYPVQIDGTEILMEWITDADGETRAAARADAAGADAAGVVLRPAARRPRRAGPARDRARRPLGRTTSSPLATGWSSSTCHRSSTWSATRQAWTSCSVTAERVHVVPGPRARRRRATSCSAS